MTRPLLSLTRNRQIGALCWTLVLLAQLCAFFFPVRNLPLPLRVAVMALLLGIVAVTVVTTLGFWTEKGDERAEENDRKANAALFTCFFLAMGVLVFSLRPGSVLTLTREAVVLLFSAVCLGKDVLFLLYERFGR